MLRSTDLIEGTRKLISCLKPWMAEIANLEWDGTQGYSPICRRALLVRQYEALDSVLFLVEDGRGEAAVPLLRTACEELIWLKYLNICDASDVEIIFSSKIHLDLLKDLEEQAGEVGEEEMEAMGLQPYLRSFKSKEQAVRATVSELGKRLGWGNKVVKKGNFPSTRFLAQATNSDDLYKFLFHATSRYVHFSPVELARRGWGTPSSQNLTSQHYEPVWACFSLSWGTRIFAWTLNESLEYLTDKGVAEPDFATIQNALNQIADVPLVPIVTTAELQWKF